jgi:hypothetical protein
MNPTLFRRAGAVTLVAAASAALAGCGGGIGATLTFNDVEKVKVSRIVLDGGVGDVAVSTSAGSETRITRIVHSRSDPHPSYTLSGSQLRVGTSCGPECRVSYRIEAPAGVAVVGELVSGTVTLAGVGSADVRVTSGDVDIRGATGSVHARTTSGDVMVTDSKGPVIVEAESGDVHAVDIAGSVKATARSGDIDVKLDAPASVSAAATSGNVEVIVPAGVYQVRTRVGSGDQNVVGITNDISSKNILDVQTTSGDLTVAATPTA